MNYSLSSRHLLLLSVAVGLLLLTCTVAAWALPRPLVGADPAPRVSSTAPACPVTPERAVSVAAPAPRIDNPGRGHQAAWLLMFSTVSIGAAIGLVHVAGRQLR